MNTHLATAVSATAARAFLLALTFLMVADLRPVHAQLRPQERKPDVTDKALITTDQKSSADNGAKAKEDRVVKQYTIEQFMDTVKMGGSSFSHDERSILFHSNKSGIYNATAFL
ncbi:MAG: hypothetical protein M3Y69_08115 [Verrucomicrobiota bacterium]|nr:hypothetical protein [Verrucomicrobiota bacterium]